ncbi:MAG: SGNH/GDSL hydrolase family protein [Oscillatoria sp. PMC 1051.18]|nr:SGNH/GDSL hydrolase family protein [Oscillatoria sp. PMC 1050.18]MEC5032377.1 SGNH/GDSL hydrolase family protein [Oscillatoria sp. PMC 1051.18]
MRRNLVQVLLIVLVGLLLVELVLRFWFGFGNPLVYVADEEIGYLLAPNQRVRRMGNRIRINEYSMRSPSFASQRLTETLRILMLGDSVANGGWWTDEAQTISQLLRGELAKENFAAVEVLNASANSWGPRNELAYLRRYGTFSSQAVVILINTDDLFAVAPNSVAVGQARNYPDRQPLTGIGELYTRLFVPAPPVPGMKEINAEKGDRVGFNLEAIAQMKFIADQNNAQLILAMTPLIREIGEPGARDYELQARQRLENFTQTQKIIYIDFLPLFKELERPESLYRDQIHLSPQGNKLVSETLSQTLQKLLTES